MKRFRILIALLLVFALVAAACGDDDDTTTSGDDGSEPAPAPADDGGEEPSDDLVTGIGVTDDTIRVGVLSDLTGAFSSTVVPLTDGMEAYFERLNDNGGIAGRDVEIVTVDTGYDVPTHQQFYDEFSSTGADGVLMIGFSTGSPHTASIRDDLTADGLAAVPLSWNSSWSAADSANIFEWGTNYCVEAINGVSYMADKTDASTVAIVSFPGDYGEDGALGAKRAAEALGLEVVFDGQGSVVPGADQTPVITGIVDADPDFVWGTLNSTTLAEIMGGAAAAGYEGQWGGNGPSYAPQLMGTEVADLLDSRYTHFAPYPGFNGNDSAGMADAVDLMREYRPDAPFIGVYMISWIQAEIVRQGLEGAVASGDLTRQGVLDALQGLEIDMQGMIPNLSYTGDPNDQITRSSFIFDISADAYSGEATVLDEVGDGTVLLDSSFQSALAEEFTYEPCFAI